MKIKIRIDTPEMYAIWETIQRAKTEVDGWPAWKRGGNQPKEMPVKKLYSEGMSVHGRVYMVELPGGNIDVVPSPWEGTIIEEEFERLDDGEGPSVWRYRIRSGANSFWVDQSDILGMVNQGGNPTPKVKDRTRPIQSRSSRVQLEAR